MKLDERMHAQFWGRKGDSNIAWGCLGFQRDEWDIIRICTFSSGAFAARNALVLFLVVILLRYMQNKGKESESSYKF